MDNINKFFEEIEANPESEKAKKFQEFIYNEYKNKTINFNKEINSDIKEQMTFLKKLETATIEDTKQTLDLISFKSILDKINKEDFKDLAIPEVGNYKYWYMLSLLSKLTTNNNLIEFVNNYKNKELKKLYKEKK